MKRPLKSRKKRGKKATPSNKKLKKPELKPSSLKKSQSQLPDSSSTRATMLELIKLYDSFAKIQDRLTCWATVIDRQGNVVFWNKVAEEISGYSRKEVLGHNKIWEWLFPDPEYRNYIFQLGKENIQKGIVNQETNIITKNGRKKIISWHSNLLLDKSGQIKGGIILGADITSQKEIEEQIRLKEKMDGLARLAGQVAHDFNNIFSIIRGYLDLVLEQIDFQHPARGDLLEIAEAIDRGSFYTSQLLTFSQDQTLEPVAFDLNKLITDLTQTLKRTLGEKIELILILSQNLPLIKADPKQIQQVILNLALNAREAMPEGGKFTISTSTTTIKYPPDRVHLTEVVSPGNYLVLLVSDTGSGMTPELKGKIFEPFISTKTGRKGMGLSQVYGIINQHNGYIWVESEPGKGTTFRIYLPLRGKPIEVVKSRVLTTPGPELFRGTETILLVEDDEPMRLLAVRILRQLGYTVVETSNPNEALKILDQYPEPIQLLLTDVELPIMNGAQLADSALKIKPELKVLYFSGYSLDYLQSKKILPANANLVAKPFSMRSLSQKVREILDQKV